MEDIRIKSLVSEQISGAEVDLTFKDRYPLKVALIGSGNWACAIAKLLGQNVQTNWRFQNHIPMYVYEEPFNDRNISDVINELHENPKYLPGHKLPVNIWACPDLKQVVNDTDILVFVLPHQFVTATCLQIKPFIKPGAFALSLIKGLLHPSTDQLSEINKPSAAILLISEAISRILSIPCDVLMGANIAKEVANGDFCEATLGSEDKNRGFLLKSLLNTARFRIHLINDKNGIEICGAAKNVIALGAGLLKGIDEGNCAVALLIRRGMLEMLSLLRHLSSTYNPSTIVESCGLADIAASCDGGRNACVAEAFVRAGISEWQETSNIQKECKSALETWNHLENTLLNGQKLQGLHTAAIIYEFIVANNQQADYPLFVQIYNVSTGMTTPHSIVDVLKIS